MQKKPHITKHKRGWKVRLGWKQCVGDTVASAYERFTDIDRRFWGAFFRNEPPNESNRNFQTSDR